MRNNLKLSIDINFVACTNILLIFVLHRCQKKLVRCVSSGSWPFHFKFRPLSISQGRHQNEGQNIQTTSSVVIQARCCSPAWHFQNTIRNTSASHHKLIVSSAGCPMSMKRSIKVRNPKWSKCSLMRGDLAWSIRMGVFSNYFAQTKQSPTQCCIG